MHSRKTTGEVTQRERKDCSQGCETNTPAHFLHSCSNPILDGVLRVGSEVGSGNNERVLKEAKEVR